VNLELSEHALDGCTVVGLHGELDLATAPGLREHLLGVLTGQPPALILDLSGLAFMDSTGLNVLLGAKRHAGLLGIPFALAAPQKIPARVLRITGLNRHFTIYPTAAEAVADAGGRPGSAIATA